MTIDEAQQTVDQWIKTTGIRYFNELTNTAILMEEVGELATALREKEPVNLAEEFADVLAWLATIANVAGVDLAGAVRKKYGGGCPGCGRLVCACPDSEKP